MYSLRLTGKLATMVLFLALWAGVTVWLAPKAVHAQSRPASRLADGRFMSADGHFMSAPIPEDEYWRRIDAAADLLGAHKTSEGAEADATAVASAADDLAAMEAVKLPSGQVLPVDNSDLVAILRRDDLNQDDLEAVRARLAALRRARDLVGRPTSATDQTFAQLEEILSRPEFAQTREQAEGESLLRRGVAWLMQKLAPWLNRIGGLPGVEHLLTIFGVAVVLATLAYVFRGTWRQWVAEGQSKGGGVADDEADLSGAGALERAHALAATGDYRQAVRYLYLSTLLWLDERRLLRYDPTLTNREFLRQVDQGVGHAALHEALSPVVDLFDRVWYGFAPLDRRGYVAYARQVERVRRVSADTKRPADYKPGLN